MKLKLSLLALTLPSIIVSATQNPEIRDLTYYRQQAVTAYKAKDYASCLDNLSKAYSLSPDYPRIIYNLASVNTLLGNRDEAVGWLRKLAKMGLTFEIEKDPDFTSIRDSTEFKTALELFARNRSQIVASSKAFAVPEKGLIIEGLAYDPATRTFYLGSIHKRKILARDANGDVRDFAIERDGLWSVLGMKVDAKRRHLWVTTTAFPQMANFRKEADAGQSAVLKFDLRTSKLLKRYVLPSSSPHALGDLTLNSKGDVFATDSLTPAIYVIRAENDKIAVLLEARPFLSPQGLAFSDDERHLYMADYAAGIFEIDVNGKSYRHISSPPDSTTLGIDGLYFYKGSLIGVQNGVTPNRLVRMTLTRDLQAMTSFTVLEANNPVFDEPTLGVLVGDSLYFIANSQWGSVDEQGKLVSEELLKDTIVLKLDLRTRSGG